MNQSLARMLTQRTMQQSLRQIASRQPTGFAQRSILSRLTAPAVLAASSSRFQTRSAASTTQASQSEGYDILVKQRLNRPVSPHLSIYRPQITWYLSSLNRVTGVALSGGIYLFSMAYVAAPLLGWHLESTTLAAAFGGLPLLAKGGIKMVVALPFTFHCWNGIRHLTWDTGRELGKQQVIWTGWTVVGLTFLSSGYLAFGV